MKSMPGELERLVLRELAACPGRFISGSTLAARLGVSRMAISKAVASLRRRGFIIESHPRLGYRYLPLDDLRLLPAHLTDLQLRLRIRPVILEEVGSTQDVARELAEQGAGEGLLVVAERQHKGRGRLGRSWCSAPGGLWFTVVLRPRLPPRGLPLLSLASGAAVALAIRDVVGLDARVKWPNDVLIGGRKVCGVLVEASVESDAIKYALVGIGVNVNNDLPEELKATAVALKELLGAPVPRVPLLRAILRHLDALYAELVGGRASSVLSLWRALSETLGTWVRVITMDGVIEGLAVDIDSDGSLLIDAGGSKVRVAAGDVIHLRRR